MINYKSILSMKGVFDLKFSIVVPAYNEGKHIYENVLTIVRTVEKFAPDFEVLPVNDGSKDNTADEIIRASKDDSRVVPVIYEVNRGKGGAIAEGVARASGDIIGFIDADLDLSPELFESFLKKMEETSCGVVIGSKMHKDSKLNYPVARKVFSFCYFVMLKVLFGLGVKDTQTGIKIYKAEYIKRVASIQRVKGFAFDIEQLALVNNLGAQIKEMPIVLNYSREASFGRIRIKDIFKMFVDTFKIWWNLRIRKNYKY